MPSHLVAPDKLPIRELDPMANDPVFVEALLLASIL